ncbi:MAG: hypothetical protein JOY69_09690 [Candidatus Eremiobacteraeota bacterium]|nr:hypothetical protein [Candidatus Eremiobacteraeota bacterium]
MSARATFAIVDSRVRAEHRTVAYACAAAAVVGFVAPHGLPGPVFFCSLLGIVIALVQGPGRFPHLDLCEQSAPLFGRQVARAKALVPCVIATLAMLAYVAAASVAGLRNSATVLAVTLAATVPSTLTALSATIRKGPSRLLYVVMAAGVSAIAFALAAIAGSVPGALGFAVLASFLALRQYGETLARYDPVRD